MKAEEISQLIYLFLSIFYVKIKMTRKTVAATMTETIEKCALFRVYSAWAVLPAEWGGKVFGAQKCTEMLNLSAFKIEIKGTYIITAANHSQDW